MSFNFGAPAAQASSAFGSSFGGFGTPSVSAAAPAFGGFGAPATSAAPAFGAFGAPTTSSAPPPFGGFGSSATSSAPAFGGFGSSATSAAPGFSGFGTSATSTTPAFGFGSMTTSAAPAFGGFGTSATSAPQAFGGFGSSTTSTAPVSSTSTFGGFGGGGTTGAFGGTGTAFGGFGASTNPTGFGGFAAAPAQGTSTSSAFGGFGTANRPTGLSFGGINTSTFAPATGGFGTNTFSSNPLGGSFNQQQPFGATSSFGSFGAPQQQQTTVAGVNPVEQLYNSVLQCSVFGDERDSMLARWNMLQASWGVGKAFFSSTQPPLDLSPENPLCRFKTIGYSTLPTTRNEDGLMSAIVRKKAAELEQQKAQISTGILSIFGNRPNLKVNIDEIRAAGTEVAEITFHLQETNPQNGQTRKVFTSEVSAFLNQPVQLQNLQKFGIESVSAKVAFTEEQIKEYLDQPPQGIDPRLWKQAQMDNPDFKTLIPVPMIGFKALQQRIQCQDQQARTYKSRLNAISDEISDLQKRHQDTIAKLRDAKRRQLALSHRVLHVMVKQEETRKIGFTIQPEEEKLRVQLEALQAEMSAPTQFKGRLNELLAKVRLQSQASIMGSGGLGGDRHALDPFLQQDIKNVLKQQQQGIQALILLMKEDLGDLSTITDELENEAKKHKQY